MKLNLFIFCIVSFAITSANSQITKGSMMFGTDLRFNGNNNKYAYAQDSKTTYINKSIEISPGVGYFIAKNLALGICSGFSFGSEEWSSESPSSGFMNVHASTSHKYSISPFVRYYKTLGEKAAVFVQANAGYIHSTLKGEENYTGGFTNSFTSTSEGVQLGLVPGFTYFLSNRFALETSLKALEYIRTIDTGKSVSSAGISHETVSTSTESNYGLSLKMSNINFGVKYYLRKV